MSGLRDLERLAARAAAGDVPALQDKRGRVDPLAARQAAVLILFGSEAGPEAAALDCEVLFVERAATLTDHPGQIGFPGGGLESEDSGPEAAALREAVEETGLDITGVRVLGTLGQASLPVSNFLVTPVLGWWRVPSPAYAVDPAETARVFQASVRELLDPQNRFMATVRRGARAFRSPAFLAQETVIWGFTGGLLDQLFTELGWTQEWDRGREWPIRV
ncbi:CoA pyrophosphatase [Acaricomes phytoseiuli]|uniref:NUDIX hydrolase n=1 Tax=Acaricomes phytoseiuli TaxID=291968 RepID=UPI000380CD41|nr:CoA pyrophosphatase [Acaricomes phytoseiuli]MCW1249681.1 CoA pyrophosphatase [Acaricomes phytoseiuli]